jgi:hypothetical protein
MRDYLRCHAHAAAEFATVKRRLVGQFPFDGASYTDAKAPTSGRLSARRTSGPSCRAGSQDQATPESEGQPHRARQDGWRDDSIRS